MRASSFFRLVPVLLATGLWLTGCPDPAQSFTDFGDRYDAINNNEAGAGTGGSGGQGGGSGCELPAVGEPDGTYLFSLAAKLNKKKAFALKATVVSAATADGLAIDMDLQPLSAEDQTTEVGSLISFTSLPVGADGSFTWDLGEVVLEGAGNPITGADVISTLILSGTMCSSQPDFICGDASGIVSVPLDGYDLTGSKFTMQKFDGALPSPVIDCDKTPAQY